MKRALLLVTCCGLFGICEAQETARQVSPPQTGSSESSLSENVTIRVRGTLTVRADFDVQLTGVGPNFNYTGHQLLSDLPPLISRFGFTIAPASSGKIVVMYVIGASVPFKVGSTNEYKDTAISGTVLVAYGEEIKLGTVNGKDVVFLNITKSSPPKK
jgi:hypothetical protein